MALFFAVEDYLEGRIVPEETKFITLWALNLQPIIDPNVQDLPLKLVQKIADRFAIIDRFCLFLQTK